MIHAIILAAGKGTRMKSDLPKVLHPILEVPMIQYVIDELKDSGVDQCIAVIGHKAETVKECLKEQVEYVYQLEQKGTGHAVIQAKTILENKDGMTLIVCGDVPLTKASTFKALIETHQRDRNQATIMSAIEENPKGYGRIIRNELGHVEAIVEEKDATESQREVKEINVGTYCFDNRLLMEALDLIQPNNVQNEYYLTDVIKILNKKNYQVGSMILDDVEESIGVNDKLTLSKVETMMRKRINEQHLLNGVSMMDPVTTYIGKYVSIEPEVVVYPGTMIFGKSSIGQASILGPYTVLRNTTVGEYTEIKQSTIDDCEIQSHVQIGPYARLRNHCIIRNGSSMGNFVEMKNVDYGEKSRCAHLTYIGDSEVGKNVNFGCGTVTVNYDGFNKFKTIVKDNAFIGCNTNLIAPVTIGVGAMTAAGSTITHDVPDNDLAVARSRQENKANYASGFRLKRSK